MKRNIFGNPKLGAILHYIHKYSNEHKFPPCIREIRADCDISSTSVVNYYLDHLVKEGYLTREKFIFRGLGLTQKGFAYVGVKMIECPVCGSHVEQSAISGKHPTKADNRRSVNLVGVTGLTLE